MMKITVDDNNESISLKTYNEIYSYINTIPALFWSIDVVKNRIEYINKYALPGLGDNSHFIIQNPDFASRMIVEEDKHIFDSFMKNVRNRKPGLAVFRIKLYDGTIRWLKLSGNQDIYRSNHYVGYVIDITDTANFIRSIDNSEASIVNKINLFDNPVFLVAFKTKKVYACNNRALEIFGYKKDVVAELTLEDLFFHDIADYLNSIYEELIFSGHWKGELAFKTAYGDFLSGTSIRTMNVEGQNFLWISVYNVPEVNKIEKSAPVYTSADVDLINLDKEARGAAKKGNIFRLLEAFLKNQPLPGLADAILYSDIHADKGHVIVWGAGEAFKPLTPGYTYSYEGTIAENIVNYRLEYIIVENTLESIKPVDWAIFIPHGIKSYYARPFYKNGVLDTVLIFCSSQIAAFNENNIRLYDPICPVFEKNLDIYKGAG